jgi:hypothetical protein
LKQAASDFPGHEYRNAARRVFDEQVASHLRPLIQSAFEVILAGGPSDQQTPDELSPQRQTEMFLRQAIRPRLEALFALAIHEMHADKHDGDGLGGDPTLELLALDLFEQSFQPPTGEGDAS